MTEKNYLRDKKVVVKYIPKKGGLNNKPGHLLEGGMMQGSYFRVAAPMNVSGTFKEFLTKDEITFYSEKLGVDISFTNKEFWNDFGVALTKEDLFLDLSDPDQSLKYKALQHYTSLVCPNPKDLNKRSTYKWCIYNTEDEMMSKKSDLDAQRKAYMNFGKFETNRDVLCYLYKMIEGKLINRTTSMIDIQGKFLELLSTKFVRFNLLVEDEYFEEKVLINTGIDYGVLSEKNGDVYDVKSGLKLCNEGRATMDVAAKFISEAKNQELRLEIEARNKIAADKG